MEVMRHSDIKLTTKTYTDAGLLPVADAFVKLPNLMRRPRSTQMGTQVLFRAGHDQSAPGPDMSVGDALQALGIMHLEQDDSKLVPTGQELAKMAPKVGLEPTTNRLTADRSTTELLRNNDREGN